MRSETTMVAEQCRLQEWVAPDFGLSKPLGWHECCQLVCGGYKYVSCYGIAFGSKECVVHCREEAGHG